MRAGLVQQTDGYIGAPALMRAMQKMATATPWAQAPMQTQALATTQRTPTAWPLWVPFGYNGDASVAAAAGRARCAGSGMSLQESLDWALFLTAPVQEQCRLLRNSPDGDYLFYGMRTLNSFGLYLRKTAAGCRMMECRPIPTQARSAPQQRKVTRYGVRGGPNEGTLGEATVVQCPDGSFVYAGQPCPSTTFTKLIPWITAAAGLVVGAIGALYLRKQGLLRQAGTRLHGLEENPVDPFTAAIRKKIAERAQLSPGQYQGLLTGQLMSCGGYSARTARGQARRYSRYYQTRGIPVSRAARLLAARTKASHTRG